MDAVQFDGLVRTVSQARSRRQALRSLAGAAGALALRARGASAQDEECKADGQVVQKEQPLLLRELRHRRRRQARHL